MPSPISEQTQVCILCHRNYTPGIVEDWLKSRHSKITPEMALKNPPIERRISSEVIPDTLQSTVVGCYECHSLNASNHKDNFEHFGFMINVIVSPNDCRTCHSVEVDQYSVSKKAHALENLQQNGRINPDGSLGACTSCYPRHGFSIEVARNLIRVLNAVSSQTCLHLKFTKKVSMGTFSSLNNI